jgi:hypothetical protein
LVAINLWVIGGQVDITDKERIAKKVEEDRDDTALLEMEARKVLREGESINSHYSSSSIRHSLNLERETEVMPV